MANTVAPKQVLDTEKFVQDILRSVERDREREIVARRFGLFDRRETLEQIGELLGITRERVRQLEKSVVSRFKSLAEAGDLPHTQEVEHMLLAELHQAGEAARVSDLSASVTGENTKTDQSRIVFLAMLCPHLSIIEEDDHYYQAVGVSSVRDSGDMKTAITKLQSAIEHAGKPITIDEAAADAGIESTPEAKALATISKDLATLNSRWGLVKWPMVNPKNIRDKIYVILKENGKHMHFNDISEAIKKSDFKRKDVTTQAIHNELIKDKRFVLIGRGIYALKEWGYQKGTVADIITGVLREAGEPLHRDEIVKRVLKSRFVKETTILLNLQGKSQFKRVAKATYALDSEQVAFE
ncbi:MAG TPA: sigma factor-like helix-turn-helix DNA-binding protein [Candidatus Saccharimonadales bacterium]|nr:sigma factor-like helix-turn-helix DNA-binding protein [Candidatus Saccharimonadales bacterium]